MGAETPSSGLAKWKKIFFAGVLPALLLLPLPAYGVLTYTLDSITTSTGPAWSATTTSNNGALVITPEAGTGDVTVTAIYTVKGTGNITTAGTDVFGPVGNAGGLETTLGAENGQGGLTGNETLRITIGTGASTNNVLNQTTANQFSRTNQPASSFVNPDIKTSSNATTLTITFTFAGTGKFTVGSGFGFSTNTFAMTFGN